MRHEQIATLLPANYQRAMHPSGPLAALLEVMEDLHAASEDRLSKVEDLFNPYRSPERLLPFLARWVAIDHLGSQRDLVAAGAALAQMRGTLSGLREAIRLTTGVTEVEIEESRPFHIVVRLPEGCPDAQRIRHLVELEKPAAITFEMGVIS